MIRLQEKDSQKALSAITALAIVQRGLISLHCFTGGGFIAPMALMAIAEDKHPGACVGCKSCEAVCPQQIKISQAMSDFNKQLNG